MADDTSKLLPKKNELQSAPTLEAKEEESAESKDQPAGEAKDGPTLHLEEGSTEKKVEGKKEPEETKKTGPPAKKVVLMQRVSLAKYKAVFRVIKEGKLPANLLLDAKNRWYLIHFLVMHNKLKELKVLITKFDCDVNILDAYNQTPLHMAALHGKVEIFKYLIQHPMVQADLLDTYRATPLVNTIKSNFLPGFLYLYFEKGVDVRTIDSQGFTVVHWAAFRNNVALLQLFQHIPTISFDTTDLENKTPLYAALAGLSYDSLKYLIKVKHASLEAKSARGQTPCEFAAASGVHPKIMGYLKKHTQIQRVQKRGVLGHLRAEKSLTGLREVGQYVAKAYGKPLSTLSVVLLLGFMMWNFWKLGRGNGLVTAMFLVCYAVYAAMFGLLMLRKDPGYQAMKGMDHPTNAITEIIDKLKSDAWSSCDEYCLGCLIRQPRSTQHCMECNRCVAGFQFHLKPLCLGLCVGERNFPVYFLYTVFGLWTWYLYILGVLLTALPEATTPCPVSLVERLLALSQSSLVNACAAAFLLVLSTQRAYDGFVMLMAICSGMTVHEMRHMHLYRYLFELKDLGDQGKRYVHRKIGWGEWCGNLCEFAGTAMKAIVGDSGAEAPQMIQLAETSHVSLTETSMTK